jgi:hypothetical protein
MQWVSKWVGKGIGVDMIHKRERIKRTSKKNL